MDILHCPYGCRGNFATQQDGNKTRILCGTCWRIFVYERRALNLYGNSRIVPHSSARIIYEEDTGRPRTERIETITIERVPAPEWITNG